MTSKLKEAIVIWEDLTPEIDKKNKDAKINADATYLNLAEASIWVNDFDKATT